MIERYLQTRRYLLPIHLTRFPHCVQMADGLNRAISMRCQLNQDRSQALLQALCQLVLLQENELAECAENLLDPLP